MNIKPIVLAAAVLFAFTTTAQARDQIRIVGSSTVFPFSTAVAEKFGKTTSFKTPVVESTGSGGGMKLFCAGIGLGHPDITNASRRIKKSEFSKCSAKGIGITEVKIGFDGIVLANSKKTKALKITKKQIFQALAHKVPVNGKLVANPYKKWSDIDPSLPNSKIEVLGPPPTSGTRDAFSELALEGGAKKFPTLAALRKKNKKAFKKVAHAVREDGAFVEAGENDNLIVNKLEANPNAYGIFGFSFLDQNSDKLHGASVDGELPTFENIAGGKYGVSRSLFFYVKHQHVAVVPGIKEFIAEFTNENTWGTEGYLVDKGLIPLPEATRKSVSNSASGMAKLKM
jgi:phosphate transport system substrate-binding protein